MHLSLPKIRIQGNPNGAHFTNQKEHPRCCVRRKVTLHKSQESFVSDVFEVPFQKAKTSLSPEFVSGPGLRWLCEKTPSQPSNDKTWTKPACTSSSTKGLLHVCHHRVVFDETECMFHACVEKKHSRPWFVCSSAQTTKDSGEQHRLVWKQNEGRAAVSV